jgi:hypothetical protein
MLPPAAEIEREHSYYCYCYSLLSSTAPRSKRERERESPTRHPKSLSPSRFAIRGVVWCGHSSLQSHSILSRDRGRYRVECVARNLHYGIGELMKSLFGCFAIRPGMVAKGTGGVVDIIKSRTSFSKVRNLFADPSSSSDRSLSLSLSSFAVQNHDAN